MKGGDPLGINRGIGKDEGQGLICGGRRDSHVTEVVLRVIMVVVMVRVEVNLRTRKE